MGQSKRDEPGNKQRPSHTKAGELLVPESLRAKEIYHGFGAVEC